MTIISNIIGGFCGLATYTVVCFMGMDVFGRSKYDRDDPFGIGRIILFLCGGGAAFVLGSWIIPQYLPQ